VDQDRKDMVVGIMLADHGAQEAVGELLARVAMVIKMDITAQEMVAMVIVGWVTAAELVEVVVQI
jgi:hypothetical protein